MHVAVGLIVSPERKILIAKRADHLHQGGLWEFPGGKVEPEESVDIALARELKEELGITIVNAVEFIQVMHDYGDKQVLLDVWWVSEFLGEPCGLENQPIKWVDAAELENYDFPKANTEIVLAAQKILTESTAH